MLKTAGLHHITAISGEPQETVDFYASFLGLRLVKKTVNFDDPGTYHFYFGDQTGAPGTILTFFPFADAAKGRIGSGQAGATVFAVPEGSLPFWENRLGAAGIPYEKTERFGETYLNFSDPHGLALEIVERAEGQPGSWAAAGIPTNRAIKGFSGVVLFSQRPEETANFLENGLGLAKLAEEADYIRYRANGDLGHVIDVKRTVLESGTMGTGTVHHIAWRAADRAEQEQWRDWIFEKGLHPTSVIDRRYFTSIYFREFGGILFEIATDGPGFLIDEPADRLGETLKLPEWLEPHRQAIEARLKPVRLDGGDQP